MQGIGVGFGIYSDGFNVQFLTGTDYTDSDFTAVSDKNTFKHRIYLLDYLHIDLYCC